MVFRPLVLLMCHSVASAETEPLALEGAVRQALERYPAVRASNVLGQLLPRSAIVPVTGPVLPADGTQSVWNSATGPLVQWEPFDFGRRRAEVAVAEAGRARAEAATVRTRLEITTLTTDTYLRLAAAEQTVVAARASVERSVAVEKIVAAQLRPGVDAARLRAERAAAETQLIQAEQAVVTARAALLPLLGGEAGADGAEGPAGAAQVRPWAGRRGEQPAAARTGRGGR